MKNEVVHIALRSLAFNHLALLWLLVALVLWALPRPSFAYACNATPSAFTFDGYPAFNRPHCYGNPIYSTTGKDTYTSNPYGNRVMTNSGFGYQCAELAQRYFIFKFRRLVSFQGSRSAYGANNLCDNALPARTTRKRPPFTGKNMPVPGDLMVWPGQGGGCGVNGHWGHVAVVDKVYSNKVRVVQQNWGDDDASAIMSFDHDCACAYIHADDNGNQNGPLEAAPADGGVSDGSRSAALDCPNYTDDSDPLKQAGLKSCCVRSDDIKTMWPVPCDGSNNGT